MKLDQTLRKFVDPLPIPKTLKPKYKDEQKTYYEVKMTECYQKLHRDLRPTRLWGYEGRFPGPTIEVEKDELVQIKWMNELPNKHFLPIDHTLHGGEHDPEVRTVVHLHGGKTPPESDGYPEAWFSRGFQQTGPDFQQEIYEYPNKQEAATLWYHDHAIGITRLNVYAGLAGFYLIHDHSEKCLNLPSGKYDIPLLIQDRSFHRDGSLFYPEQPTPATRKTPDPSVVPFFTGDFILVNGKIWPSLEVEPRKYRFRLLNGSNSRNYTFTLDEDKIFYQLGTDSGLLERPVKLNQITLAPAERTDIVIDFSEYAGKKIVLRNSSPPVNENTELVMQFAVSLPLSEKDDYPLPKRLARKSLAIDKPVKGLRYMILDTDEDKYGRPLFLLSNKTWSDPVSDNPRLGATEIWSFLNVMNFPHPIHIHLVDFLVLDRRPFDVERFKQTGTIVFTGPASSPLIYERGRKDTVLATPGEITRVKAVFEPYHGRYVWHCHILEHEDYDMMRPFDVLE